MEITTKSNTWGLALLLGLALPLSLFAQAASGPEAGPPLNPDKDYYAIMDTSMGEIVLRLFPDIAPLTVRNFVNLAEGTQPFQDPKTRQIVERPYYDGLTFHRVIPGFMIQGGCPLGTGTGGPGYRFKDEFHPDYTFSQEDCLLAMANSGPRTNGSQFFITDRGSFPQHLNWKHTIFGKVVEGRETVSEIANVQTGARNKPVQDVVIKKLEIVRVEKGTDVESKPWKSAPAAAAGEKPASQPAAKPASQPAQKPASQPAEKPQSAPAAESSAQ